MKNLLKIILNLILIFFVFFVNIDNVSCFNLNFENFQRYETRIKKSSNLEIKIKSIFASFGFKLVHKGPIEEILKYEFDVNKLYKKISNTLKNYVVYNNVKKGSILITTYDKNANKFVILKVLNFIDGDRSFKPRYVCLL